MPVREFRFLVITMLALTSVSIAASTRGISVNVRASTSSDAPIVNSVELYKNSFALVIGNDAYSNGWPPLSNGVRDAEMIAEALSEQGFEVDLHTNVASDEIEQIFRRFFIIKGNDPSARLFIWFAGHGATIEGEGYLVPVDAPRPTEGPQFKFSSLPLRDFGTFMREASSKHVYAVFDSCFAGTVFNAQRAMPPAAITTATTLPVRQFLTSGDADQEVADNGEFRELFLRAIRGEEPADANGDGYLTASELGIYMGDRVTNLTQALQTPRYGKLRDKDYDRGDFVFLLPGAGGEKFAPVAPGTETDRTAEITFWNSIKDADDPTQFDAYLKQYPQGAFAALARIKRQQLAENRAKAKPAAPVPVEPQEALLIAFEDADMQANKNANVRAAPMSSSPRVGKLEEGDEVWVIGRVQTRDGLWYRIARDGLELGFVYGPLLASIGRVDESITFSSATPSAAPKEAVPDSEMDQQLNLLVEDLIEGLVEEPATATDTREVARSSMEVIEQAVELSGDSRQRIETIEEALDSPGLVEPVLVASTTQSDRGDTELHAFPEPASPEGAETPNTVIDLSVTSSATAPVATQEFKKVVVTREPEKTVTTDESPRPKLAIAGPETPVTADPDSVAMQYLKAAQAGDSKAQMSLGYMFETGQEVPLNKERAAHWYREAAKQGETQAALVLALMLESGDGIPKDSREAARWFTQAAVAGNPDAQQSLAYMYQQGDGVDQDIARAAAWYERAANQGRVAAQTNLARLYQTGEGVPRSLEKAIYWYEKAAGQGSEVAQQNLADLLN